MSTVKVVVDYDKCKLSGECLKACPRKAIFIKDAKVVIDYKKCDSDGMCVPACPQGAIKVVETD